MAQPISIETTIRGIFLTMNSFQNVFAIDVQLELAPITIKDIQVQFRRYAPDQLMSVVASGRRMSENTAWSLNMMFAGFDNPRAFLSVNQDLIATTKPLIGGMLHSKRNRTGT